jgi:probable DNA repair protein
MPDTAPELQKSELFARLAAGHGARTTVVTPNRRLAQALARELDQAQLARGRAVWDTADILPYDAFVAQLYDDALHSECASGLPLLLAADQEQELWEALVTASASGTALLAPAATATLAREAWNLAHAWGLQAELPGARPDADAVAFADWARAYAERTDREHLTDRARLPDVVGRALDHAAVTKPGRVVAYGFDVVTPQQRAFLAALAASGVETASCRTPRGESQALRVAAADARDELRRAAQWARARLEANGDARIAIVVPDLAARKHALRRVLAQTLDPGRAAEVLPFNISLGEPLTAYPLVAHALAALELGGGPIEFERASLLIRSPFIACAEAELARRARLDAKLRRRAEPHVALDRLTRLADDAPELAGRLEAYATFAKHRLAGRQSPADWARAFVDALAVLGFPGERALDSTEYQTLKKWHEAVARFAGLDRVAQGMSFAAALDRVRRIATGTIFQPETPAVPIQVLGVLEAAGMDFDHLWVMGLSDEVWPMQAHANPFIPLGLQQRAGVPGTSPASALAAAERRTDEWFGCAAEVVVSHPRREADRDLAASPLIVRVPEGRPAVPEYATWRDAIQRAARVERLADAGAPVFAADGPTRGGSSLLKDQAACPFRAFARHRLGARGIEPPHNGLDALERGTLVHRMLAAVWRELKTQRALAALSGAELEALLARAADAAIAQERPRRPVTLAGRFAALERARLVRLARAWLEHERTRGDFAVVHIEDERTVGIGPLTLRVRLDRVDETDDRRRIVIDYKTGQASLQAIVQPRLDEPQLPLYVVGCEPEASAAAFAQVSADGTRFVGLAREAGTLPGVGTPGEAGAQPEWPALVAFWRGQLEGLAGEFASGHAAVDPKRGPQTCRECDLQPFCRIHDRGAGPPAEED